RPRSLHAFPTRRSSDLGSTARIRCAVAGRTFRAGSLPVLPDRIAARLERVTPDSRSMVRSPIPHVCRCRTWVDAGAAAVLVVGRSEEHTSELQSRENLV